MEFVVLHGYNFILDINFDTTIKKIYSNRGSVTRRAANHFQIIKKNTDKGRKKLGL